VYWSLLTELEIIIERPQEERHNIQKRLEKEWTSDIRALLTGQERMKAGGNGHIPLQ
jgi:hypothetical protein